MVVQQIETTATYQSSIIPINKGNYRQKVIFPLFSNIFNKYQKNHEKNQKKSKKSKK